MEEIFENFLILDKNKINHPAPLPNFSHYNNMSINLPAFKNFYSEELLHSGDFYLSVLEIEEKVSFLTVFGIKYKYLNRKKYFPESTFSSTFQCRK